MEDENLQTFSSIQPSDVPPKYFIKEEAFDKVKYGIFNINDGLGKKCNAQLKVLGGSMSNLISYLLSNHGITQNGVGQDNAAM
ncbi:19711_t:CDS:2 [Gigaspora rosea]|nr:19711_t:CDS:2 [Gigaspora rosea]